MVVAAVLVVVVTEGGRRGGVHGWRVLRGAMASTRWRNGGSNTSSAAPPIGGLVVGPSQLIVARLKTNFLTLCEKNNFGVPSWRTRMTRTCIRV